jgi:hypothetical protein
MRAWAAAGLIVVGSCSAGVAPNDDAERFVRALYTRYAADPAFFVGSARDMPYAAVFSPSLMQVWNANGAFHAKRRDAGFNADPLCFCQGHDWMTMPEIAVHCTGPASAEAAVNFVIEDTYVRAIGLKLVRVQAGWRVDDVREAGWTVHDVGHPDIMPSLRARLIEDMK